MIRPTSGSQQLWLSISGAGLVASDQDPTLSAATDPAYRFEPERLIRAFSTAIGKVHAVPTADLTSETHSISPASLVESVRRSSDTDDPRLPSGAYAHMSRQRLVDVLIDGEPEAERRAEAPVLLQGRPTLENFRFNGAEPAGFVDWSDAALGDRYYDLAIAARDLADGIGPAAVQIFFDDYTAESVDPVRLDWYLLAAELVV